MKNKFSDACLLLLVVTLAVGCGGPELNGPEDAQEPLTVESGDLPSPTEGEQSNEEEFTSREQEEGQNVGASAACCYVACAGDKRPGHFYGPFPNVKYGNCTNYANYYCGQRGWTIEDAKWANC